jgi:hypothetical protein
MSPALLLFLSLACRTPADTAPPVDTGPVDADADGHPAWEDCDDDDPTVFPGAPEQCNGTDDDCDGDTDEGALLDFWADADGDGWGDAAALTQACEAPEGHVGAEVLGDCDDGDPAVHPEAEEACNGTDDDCDGETDEGTLLDFWTDADGDGWGDAAALTQACEAPEGHVGAEALGDCDDGDPAVHPEAEEACNGTDDDCDGETDEDVQLDWWADIDGDGWGNPAYHSQACEAEVGMVDNADDCDDGDIAVHPGAEEACNGTDDDCDGDTDEGCDA